MYIIGAALGGLIPTVIVSRILLWLIKRFTSLSISVILIANGLSLIFCILLYGFGSGEGGFQPRVANMLAAFLTIHGWLIYGLAQAVWTALDLWRFSKTGRTVEGARNTIETNDGKQKGKLLPKLLWLFAFVVAFVVAKELTNTWREQKQINEAKTATSKMIDEMREEAAKSVDGGGTGSVDLAIVFQKEAVKRSSEELSRLC